METLLQEIKEWINATNEQIIIGISGHGAAGKTTFSKQLVSSDIRKHS